MVSRKSTGGEEGGTEQQAALEMVFSASFF